MEPSQKQCFTARTKIRHAFETAQICCLCWNWAELLYEFGRIYCSLSCLPDIDFMHDDSQALTKQTLHCALMIKKPFPKCGRQNYAHQLQNSLHFGPGVLLYHTAWVDYCQMKIRFDYTIRSSPPLHREEHEEGWETENPKPSSKS